MKRFGKALLLSVAFTATSVAVVSAQASSASSLTAAVQPGSSVETLIAADVHKAQPANVFASAKDSLQTQDSTTVAIFVSGCSDPAPWYVFSGIEALTCIFSGQW